MTDKEIERKERIGAELHGNPGWMEFIPLLQSWRNKWVTALLTTRFTDLRDVDALQAQIALIDRIIDYGGAE
jgi:hypothetical protein